MHKMTDKNTNNQDNEGKLAKRTITIKAPEGAKKTIGDIAEETIHNFERIGPIFVYNANKRILQTTILTRDSSYDLNTFYTELTKNGYVIKLPEDLK